MLGLIGCGTMGSAIIKGLISKKTRKPGEILVYDKEAGKTTDLKEKLNVIVAPDLASLCLKAQTLFLAVKPQDMGGLLRYISPALNPKHLLVSLAAGLTIGFYEEMLGKDAKVIRVMPNIPCLVGEGMIVISRGNNVTKEEETLVTALLETLGKVLSLDEKHMDVVTGLSGSGPAYVFLFIEALADGGVEMGLSRDAAFLLSAQTVLGAAKMVLNNSEHPAVLRNRVTSPGGTTSAGLLALEKGAVRSSLIEAVVEATKRGKMLKS